jgi:nitroreductase/formate hydrogenlyase subunit 6/NADH:ubiquinone oxidoreductase subunit I
MMSYKMDIETSKIKINESLCTACGRCVNVCPPTYGVLFQENKYSVPKIREEEYCVSCGHCTAICPEGALSHKDFPKDSIKPIHTTLYPNTEQIICLLKSRRSIRAFQNKPVEKELMELIIDGAKTGPSPHNAQRVEYVVVQDTETRKKIIEIVAGIYGKNIFLMKNPKALEKMPESIQQRIKTAIPQLKIMERVLNTIKTNNDILQRGSPSILVLNAPKNQNDPFGPEIDVTIALQNASLICCSLGLGSCELGYLEIIAKKFPDIQDLLGIPHNHLIYGIIAIGYPEYTFKNWIKKKSPQVTWK